MLDRQNAAMVERSVSVPVTASLALAYRTLASADVEGLPEPFMAQVTSERPILYVILNSARDAQRWREWFTGHDAGPEWTTGQDDLDGYRHHRTHGTWRGWRLDLVYLTEVESEAGAA